jgi:hypothetical protein
MFDRVNCSQCIQFIPPVQERGNVIGKVTKNTQCKLGSRVTFRKPTTNCHIDYGGYWRHCGQFILKEGKNPLYLII